MTEEASNSWKLENYRKRERKREMGERVREKRREKRRQKKKAGPWRISTERERKCEKGKELGLGKFE